MPVADTREIKLDFYFLGTEKDMHHPLDIYLRQAEGSIEESIRHEDTIWLLEDLHPESEEAGSISSHYARFIPYILDRGKKLGREHGRYLQYPTENGAPRTRTRQRSSTSAIHSSTSFSELMQSNHDEFDTLCSFWN